MESLSQCEIDEAMSLLRVYRSKLHRFLVVTVTCTRLGFGCCIEARSRWWAESLLPTSRLQMMSSVSLRVRPHRGCDQTYELLFEVV